MEDGHLSGGPPTEWFAVGLPYWIQLDLWRLYSRLSLINEEMRLSMNLL